jgi:hypothetical protein
MTGNMSAFQLFGYLNILADVMPLNILLTDVGLVRLFCFFGAG